MSTSAPSDVGFSSDVSSEDKRPTIAPFPVVGIGASAGGLEPIRQLLAALPGDTGMGFVFIQHLDPSHKSHLASILATATSMSVSEVVDGMVIESNHVYVIPPKATLRLHEGALYLSSRPAPGMPHLAIDDFFQSLAAEQGRLSIGVVLSGTGSDGSQGIKAIKDAYGITFAQDEQTAQYTAMPRSAIATGVVDFVLSPAQIAAELARISNHRYVVTPPDQRPDQSASEVLPDGDAELKQIFSLLLHAYGADFSGYKQTTLRRRIGRRMVIHHLDGLRDYLEFVQNHPDELKELYRNVLINVTSFFRDPEAFAALAGQLSARIGDETIGNSFRVWVPGCSSGEEVYSLVICVQEIFERAGLRPNVQFFGTDISEQALETARAGVYPENVLQNVSAERLSRYLTKVDGKYQINKAIRQACIFARQDVTRDTPFSRLDLVSCRNLLIYLEPVLQKALMPVFHYALRPSGLLFLGNTETLGSATDLFAVADSKHRIFSRKAGPSRLNQSFASHHNPAEPLPRSQLEESVSSLELRKKVERIIQNRYAPDSVVINQELQILQFRGHLGLYLEPAPGDASFQLLRMAREGLQYPLREVISEAVKQNVLTEKKGIRLKHSGTVHEISVEVIPLATASGNNRFFLVVFKKETPALASQPLDTTQSTQNLESLTDERVSHLERELAEARQHLLEISEDHDAALDQLGAANEELQSSNEELQSSNEELGTTKEELQSSNEELTTVNEELDTRNQQLGALNDDLTNLFAAVNVPILRVDRDLCLRRFTPAAEKVLNVDTADLGHPIRYLQTWLGTSLNIEGAIREVIDTLAVQHHEMKDLQGRWWSLVLRSYRTAEDRLDGAVLTFVDIDSQKRALQVSQEALHYADSIVQAVREPLVILTPELRVERVNASFYKFFQLLPEQTEGQLIYELANHQWNIPKLRSLTDEIALKSDSIANFEVAHKFPGIGMRTMLLSARQLQFESRSMILLAFEDITDRRRAEESMTDRLAKTGRELDRSKDELRALTASLITAHEEEQRRIASELHDDLVQRLAFLEFEVERCRLGPMGKAHAELVEMLTTLQKQIAEVSEAARTISHGMHPAILDDLGLVAALRKLAADLNARGSAPVRFIGQPGSASLPRRQFAAAVYRIAQEALRNATKYAPSAPVTIRLSASANQLLLTIKDTGPGFDPASVRGQGGMGIMNMEERARLLGGTLRVASRTGKGTTITLRVPLAASSA
jgi:two-component system, chemotaxis family, CheB/CheR fusion protein